MPVEKNQYNPMVPELIGKPKAYKNMLGNAMSVPGPPVEFEVQGNPMENPLEDVTDESPTQEHYENLVEHLDERLVTRIGRQCKDWFDGDLKSRSDWEEIITRGIQNLGTNLDDSDDAPFEGACATTHPLILETAVKFQSKATAELLPAAGPVRTQVLGKETEEALQKANRVKEFMNYQITRIMPEYYPDMERLLFYLPLYGAAFKKTYWDQALNRPVSCFITADDFVINNNAKSLEKARRYSEILPSITGAELRRKINDGEYIEPKEWRNQNSWTRDQKDAAVFDITGENQVGGGGTFYQNPVSQQADKSIGHVHINDPNEGKIFSLIEQHCYLALPSPLGEIGYTDPFIVTFLKETGEILSIRRNWKEQDINKQKRIWYSHYSYVPGFGFYGFGLFHLLGNFQVTLTSVVRSLVDAGQFANLQGGLKLKGLRIVGDNSAIAPGEWKEVETALQDISKALFPLPYKEPSQVLFQLLQWLDQRAGAFADSTEQVIGDSTNYGPVGTTVALLEASMKLFSAIHKRTHLAQERDLKLLAEINFEYMPEEYPYDVPGETKSVLKTDFDPRVVNVIPVSNPNVTSNAHRMAVAQTKLQAAMQSPQIHNMKKVYRDFYLALGEEDIDGLIPPDQQAAPLSPLEDIIALNQGKPIKAFTGQDHRAHVEFKAAWMQDGIVGGQSPTLKTLVPHVLANIKEHQILQFQEQIQGIVEAQGIANDDPKVVAQVQAEAAKEVKTANEALASMLGGEDPLQTIAQAEMMKAQTEKDRVAHIKVKDLASLALQAQKIDIDRVLAMLKGKELGADVQLNQFKTGLEAVQQGIDNLLREAEMQEGKEVEKAKVQTEYEKTKGVIKKTALDAFTQRQKMGHQQQQHDQKLDHQEEMNVQKQRFAKQQQDLKLKQQAKAKVKTKTNG